MNKPHIFLCAFVLSTPCNDVIFFPQRQNTLSQGSSNLSLEGQSAAEFSSDPD